MQRKVTWSGEHNRSSIPEQGSYPSHLSDNTRLMQNGVPRKFPRQLSWKKEPQIHEQLDGKAENGVEHAPIGRIYEVFQEELQNTHQRIDEVQSNVRTFIERDMTRLLELNRNVSETLASFATIQANSLPACKDNKKPGKYLDESTRRPSIRRIMRETSVQTRFGTNISTNDTSKDVLTEIESEEGLQELLSRRELSDKVLRVARKRIGRCVYNLTDKFYRLYSEGQLTYEDMRVQFSWSIIRDAFELFSIIKRRDTDISLVQFTKERKFELARLVDDEIRGVMEFMLRKYPPTRNRSVDGELMEQARELKRSEDPTYDMLRNAEFSFHYHSKKRNYTREIKLWLNILIEECRKQFPRFRQVIKVIFTGKELSTSSGDSGVSEGEYTIASKIHESTSLFTPEEIEDRGLKLRRPELVRILLKWIDELLQYFERTDDRIVENKQGFRSVQPGMTITLTKKRKEALAEVLRNRFRDTIEPLIQKQTEILDCLIMDLFSLAGKGLEGFDSFDFEEVAICKISQHLSEASHAEVLKLLNALIYALAGVRERFDPEVLESNIDLLSFQVLDLLRCRYVGSRQEILRIFETVQSRTDYFEVIRVKNKLSQSTRDLLINFKIKDSFLICEMQLSLGEGQQQVANHFSHYIYELHRSRFPVLLECANQVVNLDPRISYFDRSHPVKFLGSSYNYTNSVEEIDGCMMCSLNHEPALMLFHDNDGPFCCSQCNSFVEAFTYSCQHLRCGECLRALCPPCLFRDIPNFQSTYLARYCNFPFLQEFFDLVPEFCEFGPTEALEAKALQLLAQHKYVLTVQFDSQAMHMLAMKAHNGLLVQAFETVPQIAQPKARKSSSNLNIIFLPKNVKVVDVEDLIYYQKLHLHYGWHELDDCFNELQVSRLIVIMSEHAKRALVLDIEEDSQRLDEYVRQEEICRIITKEDGKSEINIDLTNLSLKSLQPLAVLKSKAAVRIVNVWENQLKDATPLTAFPNLQELYMRDNHLTRIDPLLNMHSLLLLNLQHNRLEGPLPVLKLPNLKYLDLSNNQLTSVNALCESSLDKLAQMFLGYNLLEEMPTINNCPELETIHCQMNKITSLDAFAKSKFPRLAKLHSCGNQVRKFPELHFLELTVVWLHLNKIEDISNLERCSLPKLDLVRLNDNLIECALPVLRLPKLRRLELHNNRMRDCTRLSEWETPELAELNISHNQLEGELPLLKFPNLRRLDLGENKLTSIAAIGSESLNWKMHLQKLTELHLPNNMLTKALPVLWLRRLKVLDLSHNKLTELTGLSNCKLPYLQTLRLQSNQFKCPVPVLFMERLTELYLDNNDIQGLEFVKERQLVPRLRVLSLNNNPTDLTEAQRQFKQIPAPELSFVDRRESGERHDNPIWDQH